MLKLIKKMKKELILYSYFIISKILECSKFLSENKCNNVAKKKRKEEK